MLTEENTELLRQSVQTLTKTLQHVEVRAPLYPQLRLFCRSSLTSTWADIFFPPNCPSRRSAET